MRYFLIPATIFFVVYSLGWLIFQSALTVISSLETIWSFVVGGVVGITFWICWWTLWYHLKAKHQGYTRLNMDKYRIRDKGIESYINAVRRAKTPEDVDRLERVFKDAI